MILELIDAVREATCAALTWFHAGEYTHPDLDGIAGLGRDINER
jgi:hypothetical protein